MSSSFKCLGNLAPPSTQSFPPRAIYNGIGGTVLYMYSEDGFPFPELLRLGRMPVRMVSSSLPRSSIVQTKTAEIIILLYLVFTASSRSLLNQPHPSIASSVSTSITSQLESNARTLRTSRQHLSRRWLYVYREDSYGFLGPEIPVPRPCSW